MCQSTLPTLWYTHIRRSRRSAGLTANLVDPVDASITNPRFLPFCWLSRQHWGGRRASAALSVPVGFADTMVHSLPKKSAILWTYHHISGSNGCYRLKSPIWTLLLAISPTQGPTSGECGVERASRLGRPHCTLLFG